MPRFELAAMHVLGAGWKSGANAGNCIALANGPVRRAVSTVRGRPVELIWAVEWDRDSVYTQPMRHWLFHPLVFYPLVLVMAAVIIVIGFRPQAWPREPAPVSAELSDGALIFQNDSFNSPGASPEQVMFVTRDFWGSARSLRIAVRPDQPPPTPAEQGVRILLTPDQAGMIDDRPVTVEVSYLPLANNTASGLAVSLQGIGPADWVSQSLPVEPGAGTLRFELPPQFSANAIGLRVLSNAADQNYGLEVTRIVVTPRGER